MEILLRLARGIDRLNRFVGRAMLWPLLASVLISAGNALSRKLFSLSSNGWLEIQWHLFALSFLGCAGYVLMVDEHVRVDALSRRFTARTRAIVDVFALAFVALPMTELFAVFGWDVFGNAWRIGEASFNYGGLTVWPLYLCIPLGTALLLSVGRGDALCVRGQSTMRSAPESADPVQRHPPAGADSMMRVIRSSTIRSAFFPSLVAIAGTNQAATPSCREGCWATSASSQPMLRGGGRSGEPGASRGRGWHPGRQRLSLELLGRREVLQTDRSGEFLKVRLRLLGDPGGVDHDQAGDSRAGMVSRRRSAGCSNPADGRLDLAQSVASPYTRT